MSKKKKKGGAADSKDAKKGATAVGTVTNKSQDRLSQMKVTADAKHESEHALLAKSILGERPESDVHDSDECVIDYDTYSL